MNHNAKTLPKLSYILLSHNREKYIRQAIESAFAQEYDGELEYIFSDDCSTDSTYDIIKECVASYKGNRRVVVTQTPQNMHLAGHTNHAVQFATGDFVIRADDDDFSTIDRCAIIGKAISDNPGCSCIITRRQQFTDKEELEALEKCKVKSRYSPTDVSILDISNGFDGISEFFAENRSNKAWHISVYRSFQLLPQKGYWVDDLICMYRACVLGQCISIPYITVMTRTGSHNMCRGGADGERGYAAIIRLENFNDRYSNTTFEPLKEAIDEIRVYMQTNRSEKYTKANIFFATLEADMERRNALRSYWQKGIFNRFRLMKKYGKINLFSLLRCLPMPVFAFLLSVYRKLRYR